MNTPSGLEWISARVAGAARLSPKPLDGKRSMKRYGYGTLCALVGAVSAACETRAAEYTSRETTGYRFERHERWERPRAVVGVKYNMGGCAGMPVGGLGTGTISINSFGEFERNGLMNNPRPQGKTDGCFFVARSESPSGKVARILQGKAAYGLTPVKGLRFLGHFPMLDIDYEDDLPVEISLRAMSPLIYRDSKNSGLPAIMFSFGIKNRQPESNRVSIAFSWAKPQPNTVNGIPVTCRGNVGAISSWRRQSLPAGKTVSVWVFHSVAASAGDLVEELRRAKDAASHLPAEVPDVEKGEGDGGGIVLSEAEIEFALDADGCFNWENWKKETLVWKNVPTVGQHYFAIHYDDGERKIAGVAYRPSARNELHRLVVKAPSRKVEPSLAVTELATADGTIGIRILTVLSSGSVARRFEITNRLNSALRGIELRYFVNCDVGGPGHESDDAGGYLAEARAVVIGDDRTGIVWALGGDPRPDGLFVGDWAQARDRLFGGEVSLPPHLAAAAKLAPAARTEISETDAFFMLSHEIPSGDSTGGYTISALRGDGMEFEALKNWCYEGESDAGIEPWREFVETGKWRALNLEKAESGAGRKAMAVSATVNLKPQEEKELRFLLTWYFPDQRDSEGNFIGHMYSNWFGGSSDVAAYVAQRWAALHDGTAAWQEAIYESSLPDWLKDGLVNSVYSLARNTLWIKDGRFAHSESFVGCPITETIVCRFYGSIPTAMFFPDLERNTMLQFAKHQRADGAIPFAFGQPEFFDKPYYETQKSLDSSEFVLIAYRDYRWWNDEGFLREIYPHVRKAIQYAKTLDTDDDGVINEVSMQYYDIWQFKGTSAYVGTIWLAALRAAEKMAKAVGDNLFAQECRDLFSKGSKSFDEKLWNGRYYRLYNDPARGELSETCLGNQLVGQWFAYSAGLGEILPKERILSSLRAVGELNASLSPYGLINGVRPDGAPDTSGKYHSAGITIGETFCYAATCLYAGGPPIGMEMAKRLYENIALRLRTPWNTTWNLDPLTGELGWGAEYYSNMCIWDLYGALAGTRHLGKRGARPL